MSRRQQVRTRAPKAVGPDGCKRRSGGLLLGRQRARISGADLDPGGAPAETRGRTTDPGWSLPPRPAPVGPLHGAQVILAEIWLDMCIFPTAAHLVSWARLCPRTIQSGPKSRAAKTGKGNPYLKGVLGEAATAAAKTDTFLGEPYRRIVKRRGKLKALVAVARTILVIIWHLLADPAARYRDLGAGYRSVPVTIRVQLSAALATSQKSAAGSRPPSGWLAVRSTSYRAPRREGHPRGEADGHGFRRRNSATLAAKESTGR